MRIRLVLLSGLAAVVLLGGACGNSIGDSCSGSSDCSSEGDRICDLASPNGYCTVEGCDYGTCPDESICVRFYPITQLDRSCGGPEDCGLDEICVHNSCAPRSVERRYCMKTCGSHGDCRSEYECRDNERQDLHGGDPVPDPSGEDTAIGDRRFCAPAAPCKSDEDCADTGDMCNLTEQRCRPR